MGGKLRHPPELLAWHFLPEDMRLRYRDGRLVRVGETLSVPDLSRAPEPCVYGMHASVCPLDALSLAPGPVVCRVALSGTIVHDDNKVAAQHRRVLWMADATEAFQVFARWCARRVTHLWDCPAIVLEYLDTGDENIRAAARAAARDAARDTAWAAAWDAARDTAWAAAWDAARDAAWDKQAKHLTSLFLALEPQR